MQKKHDGEDWTTQLEPADVMMVPAACYPLYPTAANSVLPEEGRLVDLRAFVFRHEPSPEKPLMISCPSIPNRSCGPSVASTVSSSAATTSFESPPMLKVSLPSPPKSVVNLRACKLSRRALTQNVIGRLSLFPDARYVITTFFCSRFRLQV